MAFQCSRKSTECHGRAWQTGGPAFGKRDYSYPTQNTQRWVRVQSSSFSIGTA